MGGGKAGEVEGGRVKSIALPKLGRCCAGIKIRPANKQCTAEMIIIRIIVQGMCPKNRSRGRFMNIEVSLQKLTD